LPSAATVREVSATDVARHRAQSSKSINRNASNAIFRSRRYTAFNSRHAPSASHNCSGDSQRGFANRLGLSLRAVCNYETGRHPSKTVLARLASLAAKQDLHDLAKTFSLAYAAEVKGQLVPGTPEETAWVRAVLALVRNKELLQGWPAIEVSVINFREVVSDPQ